MKTTARILIALFVAVSLSAAQSSAPRKIVPKDVTATEVGKVRDANQIWLSAAIFDPLTERPDFQQVGFGRPRAGAEYSIVQLRSAAGKADLERLGVKFLRYLPENTYVARIARDSRKAVSAHAAVRWVGDYEAGFKVHPRLWPSETTEINNLRVLPFDDMSVGKTIELLKRAHPGIAVTKKVDGEVSFIELSVPPGTADDFIRKAADIEGIAWIEPDDGMELHNSNSSAAIQSNGVGDAARTIFAKGLTGTGQIVAVTDSGLDSDMCYFRMLNGVNAVTDSASAITDQPGPLFPQNKVIGYWVQEDADAYDEDTFHGTHTAGTVAGDNLAHLSSPTSPGLDNADGMAPNAQILFQDIGAADGKLRGGNPYSLFHQALRGGARIHTNSYGSPSKGAYTAYEVLVDRFLFDHDEMAIIFSAGNDGPGVTSTGSPGNAKNVITVGAVNSGTSTAMAIYSSRGPTVDGRIKPDIVAPGTNIVSAEGDLNHTNGNCLTAVKQGTSMSAPTVAGGAALLRQYFTDGYYPSGTRNLNDRVNPSATLIKAALLNGTLALPSGDPLGNPRGGWGKIFLDNNMYFPGDARRMRVWDLPNAQGLVTGETQSYTVSVAGGQEFRATLVWTDPEGTAGAAKSLVNDLDLTVTNGAGTFLGNVFNTAAESIGAGSADRLNNVEQVRFAAPVGGTYTITVRGTSVPGNGRSATNRQGYALVVSAANCTSSISAAPANLQARTNSGRGVDLSWSPASASAKTQIYRAVGSNPNLSDFRYIGTVNGAVFTDAFAQGGYSYSYMVRGADDCGEGPASNAVSINAAGLCDLAPAFNGLTGAVPDGNTCRINLNWAAGQSNCPLGVTIRYNIYRSTAPDFVPTGAPYASTTSTSYSDTNVTSGTTYYYIVRAEDSTNGSGGPNRGNQETNSTRLFATAFGAPGAVGTWTDTGGDTGAYLTPTAPWQISNVESHSGGRAYHNAADRDLYQRNTCASLTTPEIVLDANAELSYWARFNLEWEWDGVIVEISTDGGTTWTDLPPAGGYPGTLADTQGTSGDQAPANVCGDLKTAGAFTGPNGNGALTAWTEYRSSLAAHAGKTVRIRWRFTSDPAAEYEGFYLDDIAISNVKVPGPCIVVLVTPAASFDFAPGFAARGLPVQFRDKSANAPTSWLWEFGDGSTSTQQNPIHTYATTGTFSVSLTVTNGAGTNKVTRTITVSEPGPTGKRRSIR